MATVVVADIDCAVFLAQRGLVWVPAEGESSDDYAVQVMIASGAETGLWSDSAAVHPAVWRKEHRGVVASSPGKRSRENSLSDVAARIDIADDVVIEKVGPGGAAGSSAGGVVIPVKVPDSAYGRCIDTHLRGVQRQVNLVREELADNLLPEDPDELGKLTATCKRIENHSNAIRSCGDAALREVGHYFLKADWAAEAAAHAYYFACGYALDHRNVASALGSIAKGDSKLREAAERFADGLKRQTAAPEVFR
jgi:hypothetical protein